MAQPIILPGSFPTWFLNDAGTAAEKIEYLRKCHAGGVNGMVMACLPGNQIPYLSDDWFSMIKDLVDEGERLGMQMWIYDEDPLPSGGASGMVMVEDPRLLAKGMHVLRKPPALKAGENWFITENQVVWAGLVPLNGEVEAVDLTSSVGTCSRDWFMLPWNSTTYGYTDMPNFPHTRGDTVWQRFTMRVPKIPQGHELAAVVLQQGGHYRWPSVVDQLNPAAFPLFKRLVLDKYEAFMGHHFSKTIPGIFIDEPSVGCPWTPWTPDLFAHFEETWGYPLQPVLHHLFGELQNDVQRQTRVHFRAMVSQRFLKNFVVRYREWCEERDMLLIGHISPEDDPFLEAACSMDMLETMKTMSIPGTDIVIPYTGLQLGSLRAGSISSQCGRPYAISETLALMGWGNSSAMSRLLLAVQKVLGIDRFSPHAFHSSSEGIQNYQVPPEHGPNSSNFFGFCEVNEWLKRTEVLMDGQREITDVAILDSIEPYWTGGPEDEAHNKHLKDRRLALFRMVQNCLAAQVAMHTVGERDMGSAPVRDGRLEVGRCSYGVVLVPPTFEITAGALETLRKFHKAGGKVFWFGDDAAQADENDPEGDAWLETNLDGSAELVDDLPGTRLHEDEPDLEWYVNNLPRQVAVQGRDRARCCVRRFDGAEGEEYLLAVNLEETRGIEVLLPVESGRHWAPYEVDGKTLMTEAGTRWQVPAKCCGIFILQQVVLPPSTPRQRAVPTGQQPRMVRLAPNILRLNQPTVMRRGAPQRVLDYPQPYWKLFDDYTAYGRHHASSFAGEQLPVESTVSVHGLTYRFVFNVQDQIPRPVLALDPRCARGRFQIFLNGENLGKERVWPLLSITPVRVPLKLAPGKQVLELRFDVQNAMEGLLSQLYVEGNFDVDLSRKVPILLPVQGETSPEGWQASGLPHYMGACRYVWQHSFSPEEAAAEWTICFDNIVDAAELVVNGQTVGRRAWAPWKWKLPNLKPGSNRFELTVHGTAGNKHELHWPNQAMGWIGDARLESLA